MGFYSKKGTGPISEINVTPLVDVVMVLLVIFMITAPLMLNGIKLDLPKTKEVNRINLSISQVVLSLTRAEEYFIGKNKYLHEELSAIIKKQFKKSKTNILYIRADYGIKYGVVAKLMSHLKVEGIRNIALVTELESKHK
ncbi:MAG: biopolymer transporter ExbD [Bacteriovoracaceae bacterium]|nr:biopolymer transporter ExbD [Bacteriovoracaceae bacterium]